MEYRSQPAVAPENWGRTDTGAGSTENMKFMRKGLWVPLRSIFPFHREFHDVQCMS
jgi:hypothetical protein